MGTECKTSINKTEVGVSVSVSVIVAAYLKEAGFDGLLSADSECSCGGGNYFMPCENDQSNCEPGYRSKCGGCEEYDFCIVKSKDGDCWQTDVNNRVARMN